MAQIVFKHQDILEILQKQKLVTKHHVINPNYTTTNIVTDSRKIQPSDTFIAYKGVSSDGHQFIDKSISSGATLIICEDAASVNDKCSFVEVSDARRAWAYLAAASYDNPQNKLKFIGVTGTNGKTSTVWFIRELLLRTNIKTLSIGTLGTWINNKFTENSHTTPDPDKLYKILDEAVKDDVNHCVMEVASHALAQQKLAPIKYDTAIFTSFSRDHLDFHRSMNDYLDTKLSLFKDHSTEESCFILCDHIPVHPVNNNTWIYGQNAITTATQLHTKHFAQIKILDSTIRGTNFEIDINHTVKKGYLPFLGTHTVENFAAALIASERITKREISPSSWSQITPVPGRLEPVTLNKLTEGPFVFVDYSHTPDALEKNLHVLRDLCTHKLITVFGCGGDRDKGKRPIMGRIAEKYSDTVIVTSDNPRTEDPHKIIEDISAGLSHINDTTIIEVDRRAAIATAIRLASQNDIVMIAGKGHEDYMIIGKDKIFFDDRVEARSALMNKCKHR